MKNPRRQNHQKHSHSVKRRLNEQDYMNIPSTEFISDKPKLGTASIMRSTTTGNESDAGESVVHYAPSSKDNSLRVVLIFKANKNK